MANRYFLNIGANWGDTANWSDTSGGTGGFSVPTNADDVFFDANSGNCTVNASARTAKTLDFTGYTNTITMTNGITVSGSVTLVAAMTIDGASGLTINATATFTSNGKTWPNALTIPSAITITLADDLSISGLLSINGAAILNGTFNINCFGGFTLGASIGGLTGTAILNLYGGTWSHSSGNSSQRINTNILGDIYIIGTSAFNRIYFQNATLTYIKGKVLVNVDTILNISTGTYINMDKINWKTISIAATATITMNNFFSGSALVPTRIQSTGANYTIAFQDGFEKITKFTKISNCTISRPGQLLCITDKSNKGGNVGVRYINQMPNGLPKNNPSTTNPIGYATPSYLLADPNTILI